MSAPPHSTDTPGERASAVPVTTAAQPAASVAQTAGTDDPWHALRRFTAARIALGRTGISLPTVRQLEFQMAHALARDAVHAALDTGTLIDELRSIHAAQGVLCLHSAAADRLKYLQRPDLGRMLDEASRHALQVMNAPAAREMTDADCDAARFELAFVVADGLSAQAVARHAAPLLGAVLPSLMSQGRTMAPIAVVEQGRVAIGDEIGQLLGARLVVVLIGERPGLSSPDSLGVYLTFAPRTGRTDAERNCISNVRPEGLPIAQAARRLLWLIDQALTRGLSGVGLKDETGPDQEEIMQVSSFLLPQPAATGS